MARGKTPYLGRSRTQFIFPLPGVGAGQNPHMPDCPTEICGVWDQDRSRCDSLCPLLAGLGLPSWAQSIACPAADMVKNTLRITCPEPGTVEIVDKTMFGRNSTRVTLDGAEREEKSKGRGKVFMLSGSHCAEGTGATLHCRLVSRGDGWHTRSERFLSQDPADAGQVLVERHVLVRPEQPEMALHRYYVKRQGEDLRPDQ